MKPSPLQLEWLVYPAASFRAQPADAGADAATPVKVAVQVTYHLDAPHSIELTLSSDNDQAPNTPYTFAIEAVAAFTFDLAQARAAYGNTPAAALPTVLAVNVARIVYSAARELLATFTARAPYGGVLVESVLIGPEDVEITSVDSQQKVLQELFELEAPATPKKKVSPRRKANATEGTRRP
jgi:preprotein translocase subunit SecB